MSDNKARKQDIPMDAVYPADQVARESLHFAVSVCTKELNCRFVSLPGFYINSYSH